MTSSYRESSDDRDEEEERDLSKLEIARRIALDTLADDHRAVELSIRTVQIT
jgi:hypothetical protein